MEKTDGCKSNPENSSTTKVRKHIPSGFSMSTILSFRSIENRFNVYRGKNCTKKFCEFLKEHAMKIINFKKKKMKLLTKCSRNHIKMQKSVIFVKKNLEINWDTSASSQVSNCDGVVLEVCLDHKFQWPQEGLNCESLAYEVVT